LEKIRFSQSTFQNTNLKTSNSVKFVFWLNVEKKPNRYLFPAQIFPNIWYGVKHEETDELNDG
jgi:hypothetical protein